MNINQCSAVLISAPSSGQGKTTITAAIARYHRNKGRKVIVFKTGPDFLDPTILQQASGTPVYQLDLWMGGEQHCRELLYNAAGEADIILIEGVMGLFDGTTSSADLAKLFNIPVLVVIDATAMAQTFGAIAYGLAQYDKDLPFAGVIANRVASENHKDMITESLPEGMSLLSMMPRDENITLPSRHLGLHQADEVSDLNERLEKAATLIANDKLEQLPAAVNFNSVQNNASGRNLMFLSGQRIAVAKDHAFCFVYKANIELLEEMGAELSFFSPLTDCEMPEADSLYLPGGYPELFLQELANNVSMKTSIKKHAEQNKTIVAECGGMLYLLDTLTDKEGNKAEMLGLLPGNAEMQDKLANLGLHSVKLPEGELRGHTYHHSKMNSALEPKTMSAPTRKRSRPESIYRSDNIFASYLHLYLPSNPYVGGSLFSSQQISQPSTSNKERVTCI